MGTLRTQREQDRELLLRLQSQIEVMSKNSSQSGHNRNASGSKRPRPASSPKPEKRRTASASDSSACSYRSQCRDEACYARPKCGCALANLAHEYEQWPGAAGLLPTPAVAPTRLAARGYGTSVLPNSEVSGSSSLCLLVLLFHSSRCTRYTDYRRLDIQLHILLVKHTDDGAIPVCGGYLQLTRRSTGRRTICFFKGSTWLG